MPALYHRDSEVAFNDALEAGFFNLVSHSERYVDDYMYTHSDERGDHFKHISTTEPLVRICDSYQRETKIRGQKPGVPRSIYKRPPEAYRGLIEFE